MYNRDRKRWEPTPPSGPPVDWDRCVACGTSMGKDEERYSVFGEGGLTIGIRHGPGECPEQDGAHDSSSSGTGDGDETRVKGVD